MLFTGPNPKVDDPRHLANQAAVNVGHRSEPENGRSTSFGESTGRSRRVTSRNPKVADPRHLVNQPAGQGGSPVGTRKLPIHVISRLVTGRNPKMADPRHFVNQPAGQGWSPVEAESGRSTSFGESTGRSRLVTGPNPKVDDPRHLANQPAGQGGSPVGSRKWPIHVIW